MGGMGLKTCGCCAKKVETIFCLPWLDDTDRILGQRRGVRGPIN